MPGDSDLAMVNRPLLMLKGLNSQIMPPNHARRGQSERPGEWFYRQWDFEELPGHPYVCISAPRISRP